MKKKSLKKVTSAVLVAAMSMGLLAGCGGSKSSEEAKTDADGATVIKFGIHVANPKKQETVTYNIVQGFNKENKGKYKVEFVAADTEAHSKNMKLAAQDGSLPEIVHLDSAEAPEYNEAGYLLDMSDFLKENKDIDDALDGMEDAFNDGKVQYGLPYQGNVQGFFYNKDLFDKAGIAYPTDDTTYDEFLDMIAKLKNSGVTPIAIGSKNSGYSMWEFNEFFSRYGWEDNEKSYTGDKAKYSNDDMNACFEKIKGLADAGAFPENMATIEYFDAKQLFNVGKAAMFGTGQWDCAEFDKNVGEHIGFWWGPKFGDSSYEQNIAMKVPAAPMVVSSAVKDNDKAKEYLDAAMKEMGVSNPADIKITLLTTDTDGAKKQAEVLQEQYQKNLGIKVEINQVTYKQRLQMETEKDYDMVVTGWVPDYSDAYSYLELWISDSQYNHSGYANAEYDKLLKDSQTETDAKTRQDMLFQAEKIFLEEDSALVPLQLRRDQYLINPKISNFNVYFVGYDFDLVYADISE